MTRVDLALEPLSVFAELPAAEPVGVGGARSGLRYVVTVVVDGGGNGSAGPPRWVAEGLPAPQGRESVLTRGPSRHEAAAAEPEGPACRHWNGEERADRLRLRR